MSVRASLIYDRRPGHAHVRRGEIGPPQAKWHHGHPNDWPGHLHGDRRGTWDYVSDVRFCPGCQGPAVELLRGKDVNGRFEIWTCVDRCGHATWWDGWGGQDRYRLLPRLAPSLLTDPNLVILREGDYDKASLARAKTRAVV